MKVTIRDPSNNSILRKLWRLLNDPFYYALSLPSFFLLLLGAFIFLFLLACIMVLVWLALKSLSEGIAPNIKIVPVKMFMASACVAMMPLVAGLISRRMTRPEVRGKFIHFSRKINYKNGNLVFTVIDMRVTQLVGTRITIELVTGIGEIHCRRVDLGPPGIIAIPTEISVPAGKLFPALNQVASCDVCGQSSFSSFKAYASHMSWKHGMTRREANDEVVRNLEVELSKIRLFRVVLTGCDEVSGKGGVAIKEYKKSDINLFGIGEDTFSVKTGSVGDNSSSSDSGEDVSTTFSTKSHYIHVDFRPGS